MEEFEKIFENGALNLEIPQELKDNSIKKAKRNNISLSHLINKILENNIKYWLF